MPRLASALADRYRIERELGAGGMATVFLAEDLKHRRKVALKVLKPELAAVLGAERFVQEITTTASLSHPHILPLFDSGEADGFLFYVMPFVDGETLRTKLDRERQLGVDETVRITIEVADALNYAHEHGVIHRDIKPENILLQNGRPMVADFGIALAVSAAAGGRMTETGLSLGTPHYMSPEQATAEKDISARSDVYSLASVCYEMLAGQPPHLGGSAQQIIMKIITETPQDVTALRKAVPANVAAALAQALEKLPADRFESAKAFADALGRSDFVAAGTHSRPTAPRAGARRSTRQRLQQAAPWILAVAGIGTSVWLATRKPIVPMLGQFAISLQPEVATNLNGQVFSISPDGARIAYASTSNDQIYSRMLGQVEPVPVPGTEGALSPFHSSDGEYLAFHAVNRLLKVALSGGPALQVAEVGTQFFGGSWNARDEILYANGTGLHLVPAAGGDDILVAAPDSGSGESYRWPEFLPDGKSALFAIFDGREDHLAVVHIKTGVIERLNVLGSNPHYVRQGYLVYTLITAGGASGSGTVLRLPFDLGRLAALGSPVPIADSVQIGINSRSAKLGIAPGGTIAFASGSIGLSKLMSVARDGTVEDLGADERFYQAPRLSPDGRSIAVQVIGTGNDIWVFDLAAKTLSRRTFDGLARFPNWTPDGRRIAFTRGGRGEDLAWLRADGSAPAESLVVVAGDQYSGDFTPDGRTMLIKEIIEGRQRISTVTFDSARTVLPLIDSRFDNHSPSLSPDGKWVAYVSNESGRSEVYVRPFPGLGGKWQVSRDGGTQPRWSPTGRELFFRDNDAMMAAAVKVGASFEPGEVRALFVLGVVGNATYANYDVTRDGNHFIVARRGAGEQMVRVMVNVFDNIPPGAR
jgi:serine/threonine-protein kinase